MIQLFCDAIINKERLFSDVNIKYQAKVHAMLLSEGYDDNGDKFQ